MNRPALAIDPRCFGRRLVLHDNPRPEGWTMSQDMRLFATTFVAGFLFVSMLLA
jgi:hypothetical protein